MISDVEAEMLRRYQQREDRVKQEYDAIFHPKQQQIFLSEEEQRTAMKRLISMPAEEVKKRKLTMFTPDREITYNNLKDCALKTKLNYQKIKGCLSWNKSMYYPGWDAEVKFKFVYE